MLLPRVRTLPLTPFARGASLSRSTQESTLCGISIMKCLTTSWRLRNNPPARLGDVRPEGEKLDRHRIQAPETSQLVFNGSSRCRAFSTGYKITVQGGEAAGSYLLTEASHNAIQQPDYQNREKL